jgi:peptidoglycan hydrolase-like protein with peptidoglycan-binding domain
MKLRHALLAGALVAGSASAVFAAGNPYVDSSTVSQVQQILNDRGFRTGVDGIMGPRTQAALKRFQKARNLEPSGQLNRQTRGSDAQPVPPRLLLKKATVRSHASFAASSL